MALPRLPSRADVLIIRQHHVPLDPRVRKELYALLDAGYRVDVLCTRGPGEPWYERDTAMRIIRFPLFHRRGGVPGFLLEYLLFFVAAFVAAGLLALVRRYRVVQVNTLPDVLVFAAAIPRMLGARVLLDLHECMPEFFATKYGVSMRHPAVRLIAALEQAAIRFADQSMTCTDQMREVFVQRGAASDIRVVLNSADEAAFAADRPQERASDGRFILICHGAVEPRYGLDTTIRAVALLADELPGLQLEIYGRGSQKPILVELAAELGIADRVTFSDGYVALETLVAAIARADAGVVAITKDRFRDLTHANKMYEYIAMRRPVVCSRTASVVAYFDDDSFAWFDSGDERALADAIRALHDDPDLRSRLVAHAASRAEPYRWAHQRGVYLGVVERLLERRDAPAADALVST